MRGRKRAGAAGTPGTMAAASLDRSPSAAAAAPNRWLFGPLPDLLLGCGLLYALLVVAFGLAPGLVSGRPGYLPALLIMIFSMSHYGGTLLRVYEERRDRRAYAVFSIWATLGIFALFVAGTHSAWVGAAMVTIYLSWSPWHYTGQNYGIALMFLRRAGVDVTPPLKRWIYTSFLLGFLMTLTVMHASPDAAYSPADFDATRVLFVPLGIPKPAASALLAVLGGGYAVATAIAAWQLLRRAPAAHLLPAAVLALTQALWFALPFSVHYFGVQTGFDPIDRQLQVQDYTTLVFIFHGIQYLWITTYYARQGPRWTGFGDYWAKAMICGVAIWTLPFVLFAPGGLGRLPFDGGMALIVAAGVNLHHFVVDGAIWKLRNGRIARVLIRSGPSEETLEGGSPWARRAVWAVCTAGLMLGLFEFVQWRIAYPTAARRGDLGAAERALDRLGWVGYERAAGRRRLSEYYLREGSYPEAVDQLEAALALESRAEDWLLLGQIQHHQGEYAAADRAYRRALAEGHPRPAEIRLALAGVAVGEGRARDALADYERALEIDPDSLAVRTQLARFLASAAEAELRAPERAAELLEGSGAATSGDYHVLDALATTYAALGRFDEAVPLARRAEALAVEAGDERSVEELRRNIALFEDGRPYVARAVGPV